MRSIEGRGRHEAQRRRRLALAARASLIAALAGCGRVGYEPAPTAPGDAGAQPETSAADLAPVTDGPPAAAGIDAAQPERGAGPPPDGPPDLAPDRAPDLAVDQPAVDGSALPASCTEPGGRVDPASGRCYFMLSMSASVWADARAGCEGRGAHLATLTSGAEQSFALGLLGTEELWIGLYQIGTGPWQWVTGEPVVHLAWAPLEPDEPSEGRARLVPDGWHGTDPRRRYLALCERDP